MRGLRAALKEHRQVLIVVTLLTLVMTFPLIVYVFRIGEFWHPAGGDFDILIKFWDIWYGKLVLTGQADRFYTDLIYYPEGASLAFHPIFMLHSLVVNLLHLLMPLSNAVSLAHLLIIWSSALSAYVYLHWLLEDRWTATFGAVIFGFSPMITAHAEWPEVAWIAPMPIIIYGFHRGLREGRAGFVLMVGLAVVLTAEVTVYFFVVVLMTLGLFAGAMAASRWREGAFWRQMALLIAVIALASAWRVIPMLQDTQAIDSIRYYGPDERLHDIASFFVNPQNPILHPLSNVILQTPIEAFKSQISKTSYLGFLPLALAIVGLVKSDTRRKTLPWLGLLLVFVVLHLGSNLSINGVEFQSIKLPKYYLNQLLPSVFLAFSRTNHFMAGVCLPLAVLSCFGLLALKDRFAAAARPGFILLLIAIVAIEYFVPIEMASDEPITGNPINEERLAFIDWLAGEDDADIRLINLPFDRANSKIYLFYQSLHGFPQTEGGISRPPDSVYDYFRANPVLSIWLEQRPTHCVIQDRAEYLAGMTQLAEDGFTHVIHHYGFYFWQRHIENFRYVEPAYRDDYVGIYRLDDLLKSCPG